MTERNDEVMAAMSQITLTVGEHFATTVDALHRLVYQVAEDGSEEFVVEFNWRLCQVFAKNCLTYVQQAHRSLLKEMDDPASTAPSSQLEIEFDA